MTRGREASSENFHMSTEEPESSMQCLLGIVGKKQLLVCLARCFGDEIRANCRVR